MLDAIWQGLAAPHAVDLKKYTKEDEIKQHFPRIIENNTANRKLVSMPMVADVGLLYYRTDCCKSMANQGAAEDLGRTHGDGQEDPGGRARGG